MPGQSQRARESHEREDAEMARRAHELAVRQGRGASPVVSRVDPSVRRSNGPAGADDGSPLLVRIVKQLTDGGPATAPDLAHALGVHPGAVRSAVTTLRRRHEITEDGTAASTGRGRRATIWAACDSIERQVQVDPPRHARGNPAPVQAKLLLLLGERGPTDQVQLAGLLGANSGTVSLALRTLEERDEIERVGERPPNGRGGRPSPIWALKDSAAAAGEPVEPVAEPEPEPSPAEPEPDEATADPPATGDTEGASTEASTDDEAGEPQERTSQLNRRVLRETVTVQVVYTDDGRGKDWQGLIIDAFTDDAANVALAVGSRLEELVPRREGTA